MRNAHPRGLVSGQGTRQSRLPVLADKKYLPYCDAVMHETSRFGNIVPLAVPHGATEECLFRDYVIPKGATLIPNLESIAFDHELFEDPCEFRPSCFLDKEGNLVGTDRVVVFGIELHHVPCATYLKLRIPPTYDDIEFPERRKLRIMDRLPPQDIIRRNKMQKMKHLTRGEETVHNKLQYGQYGVQALQGGRLSFNHTEHIRLFINRRMDEKRMFAMWRIEAPWQALTKKGVGVRQGGGKRNISSYVLPIKAGRIILELGGHMEFEECEYWLDHMANVLPMRARAISRQILEEEEEKERKFQEENLNPFNFMYCARNNFVGIKPEISKYEWMTEGRCR